MWRSVHGKRRIRSVTEPEDQKMLAARNALMSNLNYVHLQHVSLGLHLSRKAERTEGPVNQDMGRREVSSCYHHQWKDNAHTAVVDANSNDPSVPCQCCEQHTRGDYDDLEGIMSDDYMSPSDLPLSPLSPFSPSTDSSSSSDFTLDDSPISMYYKEYSQNGLESPEQPDIIPLDVEVSPRSIVCSSPENNDNNNTELVVSLHLSTESVLDSNCNALVEISETSSVIKTGTQSNTEDKLNADLVDVAHRSVDEELLPGLSFTETPKKTITSFHELAQKRRKSGGILPPQPKKDQNDWLIVFSPDTERLPINELTASAFFHRDLVPETQSLSAGKEVTTFRELRYRNKQGKEKGSQPPIMGHSEPTAQNDFHHRITKIMVEEDLPTIPGYETEPYQANGSQELDANKQQVGMEKAPQRRSLSSKNFSTLVDIPSAVKGQMGQHFQSNLKKESGSVNDQMLETIGGIWNRGLADGGVKRCKEASKHTPLMANEDKDFVQHHKKRLLNNIGSAVEKIISHFNTSRNQVQKTQLGDSRLSPILGYLILNNLCPSLFCLLADGLKPFQKDVIIGRRRLSPWNLVEASSKTGPNSLQNLFNKVNHLQQLRDPQRRFNAFIYGLLNLKQLDVWVSHLHESYDQLSVFFLPNGFLPLAASQPGLREELLLSLQPLSALTFHIDLLFEHHHLQLQDLPTTLRSLNEGQVSVNWGLPSFQQLLDIGGWISHNLSGNVERETVLPKYKCSSDKGSFQSNCPQEVSSFGRESMQDPSAPNDNPQTMPSSETTISSNKWWEHLNQASRVYIPPKRDSFSFNAIRKLTSWTPTSGIKQSEIQKDRGCAEQKNIQEQSHHIHPTSRNASYSQPDDRLNDPGHSREGPTQLTSAEGAQPSRMPTDHNRNTDEKGNWLGKLFGASYCHGQEIVKSRRPSSWLPPNINVWNLLGKPSTPESPGTIASEPEEPRPERTLRALCDHIAAGETQLSFKKGDVLQLLGNVDDDWICCQHGSHTGLVPVGYTSLIL